MIYADMHCDTLTVCRDGGHNVRENDLQASLQKLKDGGCAAQCFALFTEGRNSAADFERYLAFYKQALEEHGDLILPALRASDVLRALKLVKTAAILTVENLGFIGDDIGKLDRLEAEGVRMASLVWNFKNMLASPNLLFKDGEPMFSASNGEGLTPLGRRVCERLDELKIIIDISHLSDGGANEILAGRKIPLVASHSNARGVCGVCRNLDNETIKKIADCGGAVGINFCSDFLGGPAYESVYDHLSHLLKVGGEDVVAIGSDFDGIPVTEGLENCLKVGELLEYLSKRKVSGRILEKFAFSNFMRVFSCVRP